MDDKEVIESLQEQNRQLCNQIDELKSAKTNTSEYRLQQFFNELFSKEITKSYFDGSTFDTNVIQKEGRTIVEEMIRKFLLSYDKGIIGELEAKVFTYEKIIANSNFAPMIEKKEEKK